MPLLESIHLCVEDGAVPLHTAVVTPPDDRAGVHEDRADRDAALGAPRLGLFDRCAQEGVHQVTPDREAPVFSGR
jgi:hypothetical protein